jgi:transmembrane sensor
MSNDRPEIPALAEEAAHWLVELEDGGDGTLQRFAAWLETSPRHVEEFLLVAAVWKEFDQLDRARRLDIERLLEDARNNVRTLARHDADVPSSPPRPAPDRSLRRRTVAAAAAIAVIALALTLWLLPTTQPLAYATAHGEQRAIKLEDGSVVYLNTQSRVELRFTKNVRLVRLLEGEALFAVEHDPSRPFRVLAGPTVIQAVGTRFNVYRSDSGATVSVVEGVVQISPEAPASVSASLPATDRKSTADAPAAQPDRARISAGEQARVAPDGEIVKRSLPDIAQVVAWRERRLVFRAEPLEHVAAEFNRYNAVQIHIDGDDLRARQITGVFDADDPRSFIQFLQRDRMLAVEDGDDEISIRPR